MHPSLRRKLEFLLERHQELALNLSDNNILQDAGLFQKYSKEYSQLQPIVTCFERLQKTEADLISNQEMMSDADPELKDMAEEEYKSCKLQLEELQQELQVLLLPSDPNDKANVFLEIRAGAGGDEAAIFAGDLFRMYSRYAENQGWQVEVMNRNEADQGGFKEIIAKIIGDQVYSKLKFESGAHRVQRVPATEAQGRVHTSTCTVAIMAEPDELEAIEINPTELRIDTFRASGAGGQHVNKTDSAIRITHLPSGMVVECQDERSQHKNRARAYSLLQAKLVQAQEEKRHAEQAATRKSLVGTGDRSERIRTYNYPQGRITDHRINLTLYQLPQILEGHLKPLVEALLQEHRANLLTEMQQ